MKWDCPLCQAHDARSEEDLAYHVYYWHICRINYAPHTTYCWCGHDFRRLAYQDHFIEHGGVIAHYHACMLGAEP